MEDRNKRKRSSANITDATADKVPYDSPTEMATTAATTCPQVTYDGSLFSLQQPIYVNHLPVVQNSQIVYQVENAEGSHQNIIYVVVPENVVPGVSSLSGQKDVEEILPVIEDKNTDGNKIQQNSCYLKSYLKTDGCSDYEQKTVQPLQYSVQLNQTESVEVAPGTFNADDKNELSSEDSKAATWRSHAYRCDYRLCSKSFSSVYEKKTHMESHYFQESTEFKCNLCNMVFDKAVMRNKHVEMHAVPSNYKCKHCNKSFPYYTSLTRHIEQKQCTAANKLCSCQHCGSKFVDAKDLNGHIEANLRVCKCNAMICGEDAYQIHLNLCATCKNKTVGRARAKRNRKASGSQ